MAILSGLVASVIVGVLDWLREWWTKWRLQRLERRAKLIIAQTDALKKWMQKEKKDVSKDIDKITGGSHYDSYD